MDANQPFARPSINSLQGMTASELLLLHVRISEELRTRAILRSSNNPTGDLAEYLFCKAFGWQQAPSSARGYDATDATGQRVQIKARRIHPRNNSRQLSAIRDIKAQHFDVLAGVLFDHKFNVFKAALIPLSCVIERSKFVSHTNSNKFILSDDVWEAVGVCDVTDEVTAAMP